LLVSSVPIQLSTRNMSDNADGPPRSGALRSLAFLRLRRRLTDSALLQAQQRRQRGSGGASSSASSPPSREDVLCCARSVLCGPGGRGGVRPELESAFVSQRDALRRGAAALESTDCLGHVEASRERWDRSISEELALLAAEQRQHAAESGAARPALRFLFDSEDLFDAVSTVSVPNIGFRREQQWGRVQLQLSTRPLWEHAQRLAQLHPRLPQARLAIQCRTPPP